MSVELYNWLDYFTWIWRGGLSTHSF